MAYALITGASRGIGASFARVLAKNGYDLVLAARTLSDLTALKVELEYLYNNNCVVIPTDLSKKQAASELFEEIESLHLKQSKVKQNEIQ